MHEQFAALASRLILRNGRAMQLVTLIGTGAAWNPTLIESTQTVIGVQSRFKATEVDGVLIRSDDKLFLLDAATHPLVTQRLRDSGVDYSIVAVNEVKPGEATCLYRVHVRL